MSKIQVIEKIKENGVIPIIRTDSAEQAETVIEASFKGGISVLEVTMTILGAVGLIKRLTSEYKNTASIGAGTVLDKDTAQDVSKPGHAVAV